MKSNVNAFFCVAYGPTPDENSSAPGFRRANAFGGIGKPLPAVMMIHRDIDAPVAVGISRPVEASGPERRAELQKGDPKGRVRIGRFHATIEQAVQEMKESWASMQAAGMVYAEVCCMEVSTAQMGAAR